MATRNQGGNYQIVLSTKLNTNELDRQLRELSKEQNQKKITIKVEISEKSLQRVQELNTLLSKTEALNNYTNSLKNIQTTMQSYEKIASKVVTATQNMSDSTKNIGKSTQEAGNHIKSFGDKAMDAFQKFSLWSVVSGMFYKIVNAAKGLINTIIELDEAYVELSKVTNLTTDDFDQLSKRAYDLGAETAKTTTEVIRAMTEFARAGYNVSESTDILAKNALIWTNIADGTVDASEAANMMISVMKAFNVEAQNTTHIIDALNEVSNNFAVSSGELSNSLTKSSAVLANAGVTFEKQLGLITSGTEVLRNANIVSTGLRTISLRLQGMEEDGEKVDGLTAKLEGDFRNLGLTLYDTEGHIKDTYQILLELSEVYPKLNAEQKAYYTELIAGKTRAQVAAAVLNNFSTAIKATETAYNSAGSAAEENAKVLDSLNGRIQALKSEWESLVKSKDFQDFAKLLVSMAKDVLTLVKAFGGLKTIFMQIMALVAIHKVQTLGMVAAQKLWTAEEIKGFSATTLFKLGLMNLKNTMDVTKISAIGLQMSVFALIAVFGLVITAIQNAKQEEEALIEKNIAAGEAATANLISLSSNIDKYKELANLVSMTSSQESEFDDIENTLINTLGTKAEALSHLTKGTQEYRDAVIKLTEAEIERLKMEKETALASASKKFRNTVNPVFGEGLNQSYVLTNGYDRAGEAVLGKLGMTENQFGGGAYLRGIRNAKLSYMYGDMNEIQYGVAEYEAARKALEELEKAAHNFRIEQDDLSASAITNGDYYKRLTEIVDKDKEAFEQWRDTQFGVFESLSSGKNAIIDNREEYANLLKRILESNDLNDQQRLILIELAENTYPNFSESVDTADIEVSKLTTNLSEQLKELKNLDSAYGALLSAVDEYNENGSVSITTMENLISNYSEYLGYLVNEKGELELNTTSLKNLIEAKKADIRATIIQNAINQVEELKARREATEEQTSAIEDQTEKIKEKNEELYKQLILEGATDEDINKIISKAQAELALLDKVTTTSAKATSKTTDTWKEAFTTAYNDLKNRRDRDLIDTETYYNELQALNDKYFKGRTKYAEEYSKYELEIYKGLQTLFKEQINDLNHELNMLENQGANKETLIAKNREIQDALHKQAEHYRSLNLEGNKELIDDLQEQWWKYEKNIAKLQEDMQKEIKERFESIRDSAVAGIDKQIDALEDSLDKQNDLLDARIDSLKEEEGTLEDQKELEEKLLKIEKARADLEAAKKKKVRIYREGQGFVYEDDFDAINSAQSELDALLDDWNLFQEKSKIADIIAQLEAEKQANKDRVNSEIADLNKLKEAWNKSLDMASNLEDYKGWLTRIQDTENASFNERLQAVKDFVAAYNAEMATLTSSSGATSSTSASSASYSPTKKGSGKNSYYVDVDYQALINEAKAQGAPEDHLASLERERNNKIDGEGLSYEKTYNYTPNPNKSSGSPNPQLTGLAGGTTNADGLMHFVGENGPELYVPPKGSGIIPNPNTQNLVAWSILNPMDLVKKFAGLVGGTNIDIGNITLPNVNDANSFVEELKGFKGLAIQSQSIRR